MISISRREVLMSMLAGVAGLAAPGCARGPGAARYGKGRQRPNIVFFLVDDLGWMDTTPYGSTYYETPNVERLARKGVRFTNAYSANPLCSPTRASLMTGKYPARLHFTAPAGHMPSEDVELLPESGPPHAKMLYPQSVRYLPLEERTVAEDLKEAGYATGFVGKWHMGADPKYWPEHQGFDFNVGGGPWPGPPSYFSPYRISNIPPGPDGEYLADRLTDEALAWIEQHRDGPFYLALWHYSVHAPYQAREEMWRAYLEKRDPRSAQHTPVMAAMIQSMDESLGRLLDRLDELGIADETVIIFYSDNGGNMYDRIDVDGTMFPAQSPQGRRPTNNAPLRSGKGSIYEGGVRVPAIVYWPGVTRPGTDSDEVVSSIDMYPTMLDMAGVAPQPGKVLDGESLAPVLAGMGGLERDAVFCHFPHNVPAVPCIASTSVRRGPWKLIRFYEPQAGFPNAFELYNLDHDIGEINNLAEARPDLVRELDALIDRHLEETGAVYPVPNPNYDPDSLTELEGWRPLGQCGLRHANGVMRVISTGGDPYLVQSRVPAAEGNLVVRLRMRSESSGASRIMYTTESVPHFRLGHPLSAPWPVVHDGDWHEYEVPIPVETPLQTLRIDPSRAPGVIDIDWIRLLDEDGDVLAAWEFD